MKNTFYFIIAILFTLTACKDEPLEPKLSPLADEIKSYMFNVNSFWVYENPITLQRDSIYIISVLHDTIMKTFPHSTGGIYNEIYQINMKSTFYNDEYNDYLVYSYIKRNGGGEFGELGQPIYWIYSAIGDEFNGATIVDMISNLEIEGNTFNNIKKMKITKAEQYQQEFDFDTYLYFVDGVGIVKKEYAITPDSMEVWNLVKWNVKLYNQNL